MASVDLEYNQGFKIYNANGTRFNNLVLHKATYETVVMSLGDKISGIVYYKNNKLVVDMTEYIMYKDVKYVLVNPPTVIKEGLVSDNGELKGMTKYSFTFYHPMYMLSNFPFSDVAVDDSQKQYLSQNKTFSWIGNLVDYKDKLNKNLEGTQWKVSIGTNVTDAEKNKLSEVLSFDNNTIADALKTAYETWKIPYIVDKVEAGTQDYLINRKRFVVQFGLPSDKIYKKDKNGNFVLDDNNQKIPFVFKYGQGVGLKNNSRTPKNNKIVTRIAGYGSEDNIPYGYPQIVWTGNQDWNYTINNDSTAANSYPIYDGIVGGQKVRLIKHPFTRTHLMPPIYKETVNKKVNPNATSYDPDTKLVDYYDADDNTYPNQIKAGEPSYEIHEFEDIKPEFGSFSIYSATPYDGHSDESITQNKFLSIVDDLYTETDIKAEKTQLNALRTSFVTQQQNSAKGTSGNYEYDWSFKTDGKYKKVKYASSGANFEYVVNVGLTPATIDWDDTMDEQGKYVQSYFKVTIPALGFDLYASAAITQEMTINMRSGACIGCSFPVMVDWDDYKRNFYDKDGNFAPNGTQRNLTKYPNSTNASITLILQKETNTFGTLMPNIYQKPASGDKFVILGISLPTSYITTAEGKLETEMKKYMRDNNVYYYEYPLKFDEHFLISNEHILSQMKPNVIVNFEYADVEQSLYIKQMSIKYNESPLPKYDITLTDDVDVVLNKIGEAIAEYRGQRQYENGGGNSETLDGNKFLRKDINDTASGTIRMLKGLQVGERFVTGLLGEGGIFRKDDDGTTYLECDRMYVRMKAYFDTVEVRRFLHSGGNRIASAAGIKCSRVEYIASNGLATQNVSNAVKFRCYFRAQDNGVSITNDFVAGDQAYCKETNANLGQHGYWRLVVGKTNNPINGELWIDLSASDCLSGSDIPIAQDDIIQLGHRTDKTRQGAIIEYVSGEDAPSYQIYQGINSYSLEDKNYIGLGYSSKKCRAYMNVYGDMFVGVKPDAITGKSPTYIEYVQDDGTEQHKPKLTIKGVVEMLSPDDPEKTTTLDDFAKAITGDIEYLQQQVDGEIDTWFYDGVPTLNNYPAIDWTTDNLKKEHLGDLYYDKLNGNAYRFIYDKDNETYSWLLLSDSAILEALRIANEAKDTADHKRRVFLTDAQHPHPTPPYDEGDLWVNAVWPYEGQNIGSTYNDEFLKCTVAKAAGQGFAISDWSRTSTHAENVLQDFIEGTFETTIQNIKNQVDHKVQTWYQSTNPANQWEVPHDVRSEHVGDLWYCTTDIEDTNFKKDTTWQYVDNGEGVQPRYQWKQQNVPEEIFDKIDGKRAIYSEWNGWMTGSQHQYNQLQEEDLFIPQEDTTPYDVTFKANKVYRCTNAYGELIEWPVGSGTMVRVPRFQEIAYTDDSAFNGYINAILNGTGSSGDAATVAAAQKAIKEALGNGTLHEGGLVLTSLIGMRDKQNKVWAGINGQYQPAESGVGYKGHGIAAWYGGGMADWEVYLSTLSSVQQKTAIINDTYAKSLFRFDGSGYVAGGNVTWDKNGAVTIKNITTLSDSQNTNLLNELATFNNAFTFNTSGTGGTTVLSITPKVGFTALNILDTSVAPNVLRPVATQKWVDDNFVTKAFFNRLFQAYSSSTIVDANKVSPNDTTSAINNLKILVGTWTEQYLSALGNNPNASGGGGISDLSAVLNELNSKDDLGTGVLVRNGLNNWSWMPYNTGTSGIDVNAMWAALGGTSDNKKIDNSHLSLKSLTFKAGSEQNGVEYSPTGTDNTTITFDSVADSGISVARNGSTFTIGNTEISGLTPNTYRKVTVDKYGRVAAGENPTTLAGYGITDAKIEDGVITLGSNTITPLTDANIKNDYTWWGQKLQTTNNKTEVKGTLTNVKGIRINDTENKDGEKHGWIDFHYAASQSLTSNIYEGDSGRLVINEALHVIRNGNVGIGTNAPSYKLDVNGNGRFVSGVELMHANTIKAMLWSDNEGGNLRLVSGERWVNVREGWVGHYWEMDSFDGDLRFYNYTDMDGGTLKNVRFTTEGQVVAPSVNTNKLYLYKPNSDDTGAIYLEYIRSGTDKGVHLAGDGLWVDGFVSALGTQSSGGQDTFNADLMWQELGTTSSEKVIPQSHLNLSGYALTSAVTKTLTIKNSSGDVLGTYDGTQEKTITISGVSGNYLPLTGGTLSCNVDLKYTSIDATKDDNNITSTNPLWPSTFSVLDNGNRIVTRTESVVSPNGNISWYSYVRQYDSTHTSPNSPKAQRGIKYTLTKSLVGTWAVDDAPSFRTALGINLDNLVTTNTAQTISGAKTFSSLLTANANVSIGGQLLVGANSTSFRVHVMGGIVSEYDSTYKGSFRAVRGDYMGSFGVNGSGYTVFVTSDKDGNNGTSIMSLTPYNATDKYALFPHNVRVGYANNTAVDGAYVKIGGVYLIYDQTNNAIRVSGSSSLSDDTKPANIYAVGGVSALGSQSSGGQDYFNADLMWQELGGSASNKVISNTHLSLGTLTINDGNNTQTWTPTSGNTTITISSGFDINAGDKRYLKLVGGDITGTVNFKYGDDAKLVLRADGEGGNIRIVSPSDKTDEDGNQRFWEIDSYDGNLRFYTRNSGQTWVKFGTDGNISTSAQGVLASASDVVTAIGTSGNNLTWTKNGTTNNITVPYATSAGDSAKLGGKSLVTKNLNTPWDRVMFIDDVGGMEVGSWFDFHYNNSGTTDYSVRLSCAGDNKNIVTLPSTTGTLALTSDNVASASKLKDSHSLWGNSFNGTQDIFGNIEIRLSNKPKVRLYANNEGGNIRIYSPDSYTMNAEGQTNHFWEIDSYNSSIRIYTYDTNNAYKSVLLSRNLDFSGVRHMIMSGSLTCGSGENTYVQIGGAKLIWDGSALKCDKDFYSTGAVSALGSNTSGGGSGISDISVAASLSGTTLTINVSGQTGSVDLSSISGTSGDYIPLSGGNVVTGNLNPATGYNNLDLGNSTNKWRQLYLSEFASVSGLVSTKICIDCNAGGYNQYGGVDYIGEINNFDGKLCLQYSSNYAVTIGDSSALNANDKLYVNGQTRINGNLILDDYTYNNTNGYKLYADGNVNITGTLGTNGFTANMGNMNFLAIAGNINTAYKLYIGGDGNSKSIYAEGSIYTHGSEVDYSDIRLKNIVEYVNDLTVDKVAKAPLFKYYWRDRVNDRLRIGTSAQYWQEVLPQAVEICSDGYLGISYAITALASSVSVARKVVDHELRIKQLEQENAILRKEIEELKAA